ncbi:GntR family transcriptional regulator [Pusillimonas harenae]|uniref:GntR family transcriptional regulator n=2 Tax=Pollutimonas harenae TaxID=657015 RepID=A0A853GVJ9_9BURK|nr:GntR family transcriptional regulator [Pollutimonas harenae]TEA71552.1 GntR family transcriptional regulator [Pollutimonas harenae]
MAAVMPVSRNQTLLKERAADSMREAILSGVFAPGQKLVERELCEQLDVSRSCVREALQHLQSEGLIKIIPHKGPEVAVISKDEVVQLYAVRKKLEGLVGASFCTNASPQEKQELKSKVKDLAQYLDEPSHPDLLRMKNEFYAILLKGAGNEFASAMLRQLNNRVSILRRISMAQAGRLGQTIDELEAIVQAIDAGNPDAVEKLCEQHVENSARNLLLTL